MTYLPVLALTWMLATSLALGADARVRVAVIATPDAADIAALTTAELSHDPNFVVLERDDLAKVGDELKLQQLAGSDAVRLGKLIGADGLIFISKGPSGLLVRFTAVNLGYALFDDQIASATDLPLLGKSISHRVVGYAPKLKLDPAKAIPLSILNLRADYGSTQSFIVERNLTLLLESRLTAVPDYVVLERRHAWSLGFEHSLDPAAHPLLAGAYLIDGSLSLSSPLPDKCKVALRIRVPNGKESTASFQGSIDNLPGLADQIRAGIQKTIGGTLPVSGSSSQTEANEYLSEALWGWRSRAPETAVEAADSAELLGGNEADILPLRARSLGNLAENGMESWLPFWNEPDKTPAFDAVELSRRTDWMLRALDDAARYENEKLEPKRDLLKSVGPWEQDDFTAWSVDAEVVYVASKLLVLLDAVQSPRADELRRALQPVSGYDPFHGKAGKDLPTNFNNGVSRRLFADSWATSLDEELAYYRLVFTDKELVLPTDVILNPKEKFCQRFLPIPEARQKAFDELVESLKSQPQSRRTYFVLKTHDVDPAVADGAYRSFLDELWPLRDELVRSKSFTPLLESFYAIKPEVAARNTTAGLPLLHYLLTSEKPEDVTYLIVRLLWHPNDFPAKEVPSLWAEFNGYRKKVDDITWAQSGRPDESFDYHMDQFAAPLIQKYPTICVTSPTTPASPVRDSVAVTKFWHPWTLPGTPDDHFIIQSHEVSADGIWLGGLYTDGALYHVNLSDFTAQDISTPDKQTPMELKTIGDHVYMTYFPIADPKRRYLARFDTKSAVWESRVLPDLSWLKLYEANGALYLFVTVKGANEETALVRYDWDNEKWIELANNRRRPARNQFDDTSPIIDQLGDIFTGPDHRACITVDGGTFYIREEPGNWPPVFDDSNFSRVITVGDRSLVIGDGEATMLDGDAPEPQYWVANSAPHVRRTPLPGEPPVREPTPWLARACWQVSAPDGNWRYETAFHGNEMYLLQYSRSMDCCELLCYLPGESEPRHIPLTFHLDDSTRLALASKNICLFDWTPDKLEHPEMFFSHFESTMFYQLVGTHQGICFLYTTNGFWFLPYSDIDAYIKSHPGIHDPATPPLTTAAQSEKGSRSSTEGDADFDPGDPTSFR